MRRSIQDQLNEARVGGRLALPSWEVPVICRAIDVLRRVAENECTNPQREAEELIRQIDEKRDPL